MKARISTDIQFNPHGHHNNSGVNQWFNECLIAIAEINNKLRVVELPPQATEAIVSKRSFGDMDKAEVYIEKQWDKEIIVTVQSEDIQEEIERRRARWKILNARGYQEFLEGVVDDVEYEAYLEHKAMPSASEY